MTAMSVPTVAAAGAAPAAALGEISPTREEFRELAVDRRVIPVTRRLLADAITPVGLYATLAGDRPGTFLLESAENGRSWSRWSFVGVAAPAVLTERDGSARLAGPAAGRAARRRRPAGTRSPRRCGCCTPSRWPELPPLTGGMVGYLGYDVVRRLERIDARVGAPTATAPAAGRRACGVPELVMLLATDLAALDHHEGTVTLIANAVNWDDTDERVDEAYDDAVAPAGRDERQRSPRRPSLPAAVVRHQRRRGAPADGRPTDYRGHGGDAPRSTSGPATPSRSCCPSGSTCRPRRTRWTSTGCCGPPTRARTCTCCGCRRPAASRSPWSAPRRRRWSRCGTG